MESSLEFVDMVLSGNSPEEVTDKIKEILYTKCSNTVDELKSGVAQSMFASGKE